MSNNYHFLKLDGIGLSHPHGFQLHPISFSQKEGQHIAIVGASGSGKTTLLKIIAGHYDATEGSAFFKGKNITGPLFNLVPGHKGIAYLSQHFELRNNYLVADYIDYGNTLGKTETDHILSACEIIHLLQRKTNSGLSGGEKQRIALAKLLLTQPKLLLLDEPFTNLDFHHKTLLQNALQRLEERYGITYTMVSHDPRDLLPWADTILVMQNGAIIQSGNPHYIFYHPEDLYTARLFGPINVLSKYEFGLLGQTTDREQIFIRPSTIIVSGTGTAERSATIISIAFLGHHFSLGLWWQNRNLTAFVQTCAFTEGETVFISVAPIHAFE